jgi:uncharacterized OB-fold protein
MTDAIILKACIVAVFAAVVGYWLLRGIVRGRAMDPNCPECGHVLGRNHAHCQACADDMNDMAAGV